MPKDVIGSVMVVGGGIAGMQAALDLADSGYYVYLVEKVLLSGGSCPSWTRPPHLRLRDVNHLAQTGRGRPASEHRAENSQRSQERHGRGGKFRS